MQKKCFNRYSVTGITDVGHVRQQNEDTILIDEELCLMIVADGMGGHQAGEIASQQAVSVIRKILGMQQSSHQKKSWLTRVFTKSNIELDHKEIENKIHALETALREANHHIYQLNRERNVSMGHGMGTTLAGCWIISEKQMLVFHIGDSRIYQYRKNSLMALTKDHSILQEWYSKGCMGDKPGSNVITRAVGPYALIQPEIQVVSIDKSDAFLMCSDGLTDRVEEPVIEKSLQGLTPENSAFCCQKLIKMALNQGGNDNISIIIMTQD